MENIVTASGKTVEMENVSQSKGMDREETSRAMHDFPTSLEYIAGKMTETLDVGEVISVKTQNIGITVAKMKKQNHGSFVITSIRQSGGALECLINTTDGDDPYINKDKKEEYLAIMDIPASIFPNISNISIYSLFYKTGAFFENEQTDIGSSILSVTVNNKKLENLKTPIDIQFKVDQFEMKLDRNLTCSYWNKSISKFYSTK